MRRFALPAAALLLTGAGCTTAVRPETPRLEPAAGLEFVLVPGGTFQMGDESGTGEEDEHPAHPITLPSFWMSRTEVTQAQWLAVMGSPAPGATDPSLPATSVSWFEAEEFIGRLRERSGKAYRLPTEAEWEYAARSGGRSETWAGTSDPASLPDYAWLSTNSLGRSQPVGTRKPNHLGLFDLTGNAAEWCRDWYGWSSYRTGPRVNPQGPESGKQKVVRDCSFAAVGPGGCRTTLRDSFPPDYRSPEIGFRIVSPAN